MNTPLNWKMVLAEQKLTCKNLELELKEAKRCEDSRKTRTTRIAILRLVHITRSTYKEFWKSKPPMNSRIALPSPTMEILRHKNTPLLLTIFWFCQAEKIPLRHWFTAQFDTLKRIPFIWITCFYGPNAMKRYLDWDYKLARKFIRTEDREQSFNKTLKLTIRNAVFAGHRDALKWQPVFKEIQPPTTSAALAYINTYVPAWYLVAHQAFRDEILEPGILDSGNLVKLWTQYKKSPWARKFCHDALEEAETRYGKLETS